MDILDTLALALGFATLAGINLYLTVLVTGLAIRFDLLTLSAKYADLAVLGDNPVLIAAGLFFLLEFFADKVPWVDSLWDSVHTLVRPIGGGLLALSVLGELHPAMEVIIALLAGGTTLVAHSAKAGTRLAVNTSPEPVSNIAVSTAEDVGVVAGSFIMWQSPIAFGLICLLFLGLVLYFTPRIWGRIRNTLWLLSKKVRLPFAHRDSQNAPLPDDLTDEESALLAKELDTAAPEPLWAVPTIIGKAKQYKGVPTQAFGKIIADRESPGTLFLAGKRRRKPFLIPVPITDAKCIRESRFLSEDLVIHGKNANSKLTLRFPRGRAPLVDKIIEALDSAAQPAPESSLTG
ncbi:MAG: DUF4126 domain-containing protein [Verrucomicrobiota bacterium]